MYCATIDRGPCKHFVKSVRRAFVFMCVTTSRGHIVTYLPGLRECFKTTENRLGNLYFKKRKT